MYWNVFLTMFCAGAVMLFLSLVLMFSLHILDSLDEITGRKAKRQVKRLRDLNVSTNALDVASTEDIYKIVSDGSLLNNLKDVEPENVQIVKYESKEEIFDDGTEATSFMDECATTCIEGDAVSEVLAEVKKYTSSRRIVEVIEEQSSIFKEDV